MPCPLPLPFPSLPPPPSSPLLSTSKEPADQDSAFRIQVEGFRAPGFRFRAPCFGFRGSGFRFRVSGFGFRVSAFSFRFSVFGFRFSVSGVWCRGLPHAVTPPPPAPPGGPRKGEVDLAWGAPGPGTPAFAAERERSFVGLVTLGCQPNESREGSK